MKKLLIVAILLSFISAKADQIQKRGPVAVKDNKAYFKDESTCKNYCECATHDIAELQDYPYVCKDKTVNEMLSENVMTGITTKPVSRGIGSSPQEIASSVQGTGSSILCMLACIVNPLSWQCRFC